MRTHSLSWWMVDPSGHGCSSMSRSAKLCFLKYSNACRVHAVGTLPSRIGSAEGWWLSFVSRSLLWGFFCCYCCYFEVIGKLQISAGERWWLTCKPAPYWFSLCMFSRGLKRNMTRLFFFTFLMDFFFFRNYPYIIHVLTAVNFAVPKYYPRSSLKMYFLFLSQTYLSLFNLSNCLALKIDR